MRTKFAIMAALLLSMTVSTASFARPKASGIAGVVYGVTVGVPVKIAREVVSETKRMTRTLEDDFETKSGPRFSPVRLMIYGMTVPYGLVSGSILGSVHGVGDAFKYGYEQPFSKVSIGLGEDEVAMKTVP